MRNVNTRTKTLKCKLNKCKNIFYAYSDIQFQYGKYLDSLDEIIEIFPNIKISDDEVQGNYTSDFYCIKSNGEIMVRECLYKSKLMKPLTCKYLDMSRNYWLKKGILDWGIILDE